MEVGFVCRRKILTVTLTLIMVLSLSVMVMAEEVNFRIYHTNDTHARVVEDGYAGNLGFAKVKSLIDQGEKEVENVLYLDAGDTLHGQVIANINQGEAIAHLMNVMGLDAQTLGNHDFNYGQNQLKKLDTIASYPFLAANLKNADGTDSKLAENYLIKEMDGVKVGIFGLASPETAYKTHPKNVEGLVFASPVEVARDMVAELENKVDVIIGLTHLGLSAGTEYTSARVAQEVAGIDIIIDGHSHDALENGRMVNGTLIAMAGEYDKNLGVVEFTVENGQLTNKSARLITKEMAADVEADPVIAKVINSISSANEQITSQVVGETAVELNGAREDVRTGETNLGSMIADAIKEKLAADLAITNGGGIRASIDQGKVTKGEVITVLPFGNTAMSIRINGETLVAALEHAVSKYPAHEGLFPQVSGVKFTFNPEQPVGERVVKVTVNGEPVEMDQEYVVATNDFMAAGGDGYTMFASAPIVTEAGGLEEIVMEYISNNSPVSPEKMGRISTVK